MILWISCKQEKRLPNLSSDELQTKRVDLSEEGAYELISYYQDTIKHGIYEKYNDDGRLERSGYYYNDSMAGRWAFYDSAGTLQEVCFYRQNKPNGIDSVYYPDGTLQKTGILNQGIEQGPWEYYRENGSLKSRIIYADGKPIEDTYEEYEEKTVNP